MFPQLPCLTHGQVYILRHLLQGKGHSSACEVVFVVFENGAHEVIRPSPSEAATAGYQNGRASPGH